MSYGGKPPSLMNCLVTVQNEAQRIRINQAQLIVSGIRVLPDDGKIKNAEEYEAIAQMLMLIMDNTAGFKKFIERTKGKNQDAYERLVAAAERHERAAVKQPSH